VHLRVERFMTNITAPENEGPTILPHGGNYLPVDKA
jgi:hypothetical protein